MPTPIQKSSSDIKKLRLLAENRDVDLWFEDECHFQQHGSRCTMWVPPEDVDPVILHAPTRKSMGVVGAVCADDGRLVIATEEKFNAATFLSFLKRLLRHRRHGRIMTVVLDNSRYHRARLLEPWLWEHRDIFKLDFLPPYSPELNNMERVWRLTRTLCTHNRYFPALDELVCTVTAQLSHWFKPNKALHKLCAIT